MHTYHICMHICTAINTLVMVIWCIRQLNTNDSSIRVCWSLQFHKQNNSQLLGEPEPCQPHPWPWIFIIVTIDISFMKWIWRTVADGRRYTYVCLICKVSLHYICSIYGGILLHLAYRVVECSLFRGFYMCISISIWFRTWVHYKEVVYYSGMSVKRSSTVWA